MGKNSKIDEFIFLNINFGQMYLVAFNSLNI